MPNKTISVPDDVVPIIESLDVPFSRWVADQLRRHAAETSTPIGRQFLEDAELVKQDGDERRPNRDDAVAIGERMGRSAPW
ncbi:MAG TPA: hypothetical protein VFN21_08550 [Acidimicrobiales bacterium]|nr:hypothetical protein [Acidimicrobiales bacterium]